MGSTESATSSQRPFAGSGAFDGHVHWRARGARSADAQVVAPVVGSAQLETYGVCAWFSGRLVLGLVSLIMERSRVTALIGPSGCGKSTFLRILNRMHEVVPGAQLAGSVELDGSDIYGGGLRATDTSAAHRHGVPEAEPVPGHDHRRERPLRAQVLADQAEFGPGSGLVEEMLTKAGLWNEVKDRLGELGGALSGGQQQRLCIARALAVRPRVLLMDEPCSALDPTSTNRIEETIREIADEVTVVIVTHNMQQAQRVSALRAPSSSPRRANRVGSSSSATPRRCSAIRPTRAPRTTSTGGSDEALRSSGFRVCSPP